MNAGKKDVNNQVGILKVLKRQKPGNDKKPYVKPL